MPPQPPERGKLKPARLCSRCVTEPFLRAEIDRAGQVAECSYCGDEGETFTIAEVADRIEKAFEEHFERTSTGPDGFEYSMLSDKESNYEWERHGQQVLWAIANAAGIDEDPASHILAILEDRHSDREYHEIGEECEFDSESYYERKKLRCDEHYEKWNRFEKSIKEEGRFFNREATSILEELFRDLPLLQTGAGKPVVVMIGPAAPLRQLYRARVFAGEDTKLEGALKTPWKELGSPPMAAATSGRMNARGISVFYGADTAVTAIAEVRPPVGSKVAVARFDLIRPLRVLDVEALKSVRAVGSIFDPEYLSKAELALFMEVLSARIVRPVMPNEEAFEYIATQAVADYLANISRLDGIIFPSVQTGQTGSNVVLFHHAARVEEVVLAKETRISAHLEQYDEDGPHPDYWVLEEMPPEPKPTPKTGGLRLSIDFDQPFDHQTYDARSASLRIDRDEVKVHHIEAVSFTTQEHSVRWSRSARIEHPPF